jgi:hypothetical protein
MVILYVGKQRVFQIAKEYDGEVLFSFLLCAYKILNPTNANDRNTSSYVVHSSQSTSLYDVMESDDDMALLVVKGQLTHLKIKKSQ